MTTPCFLLYLPTQEGRPYLAVDLFSRQLIGWSMCRSSLAT